MVLFFRFVFSLDFGADSPAYTCFPKRGRRMSDFTERFAAEIRHNEQARAEERKRKATENAAFVEREALKRKLSPDLWHNLREKITAICSDLNKRVGKEYCRIHDEMPTKLHVIRISPTANLRLEFFPDGNRIHFESGSCVGDYLIDVDTDNGQVMLTDAYHRVFELEATAEHLLECLEKAQF